MKHTADNPSSVLLFVQRILAGLLILIILAVLAGTIYALIFKPNEQNTAVTVSKPVNAQSNEKIFTGIGRIRAKSAEPENAAVLITIAFPYNSDDVSFSEELALKVAQFRNETNRYFEAHTASELRSKTDTEVQRELLARYNAQLRLGFIDTLYITDYMIIE